MDIILSAISQGIIWGILSIGLFISFRILNIADMTTEGAFPLGAGISILLIKNGFNPIFSLIFSILLGIIVGFVTGFLITYCEIPSLLAGILTMTGLFSVTLRIMGQPNVSILKKNTIFDYFSRLGIKNDVSNILCGIILVFIVITVLYYFFNTDLGQSVIATGDNKKMAVSMGINSRKMIIIALMLSNGIVALSGGIIAQFNRFSDINSGIGTIVVALSGIIIGEILFRDLSFLKRLISIVYGSVIYRLILVFVLSLKFINANDFKLISALIIILCLSFNKIKSKIFN